MGNDHKNYSFRNGHIVTAQWRREVEECVTVIIKDSSKPCDGGCGKTMSIGDVAFRVMRTFAKNGVVMKYYCVKCHKKRKREQRRVDFEEKRHEPRDKFVL
jgi:hypothetical protein